MVAFACPDCGALREQHASGGRPYLRCAPCQRAKGIADTARRAAERRVAARVCGACGVPVEPRRKWCAEHRNERYRARLRDKEARRRLRETDTESERFDPREIFERDGWVCHLCGLPVKRERDHPADRLGVSLDHLVPLALGGAHARSNVATAHFVCNARKGARRVASSAPDWARASST